jgi:hypothetical protein
MGLHLGPLATSPDQTTLPSEVIQVLGKVALESPTAYVHIRSGIDSLLGDTHLVVIGGKLHVVARKSSLDALEDVPLVALPEIDEEGYRSVLQLRTTSGDKRVEIGATEENAVHALIASLGPEALDVAVPASAAEPTAPDDVEATDLGSARDAFLALLAARRHQRREKLRADREAHERAGRRSAKPKRRAAPVALIAEVGTATTDRDGDGIPDPPGDRPSPSPSRSSAPREQQTEPPQQSSILGLAVLTLLVMLGLIGVASRLLGK